jgi:hypothetical protein
MTVQNNHVTFLTKTQPWFQSFFPTGVSYDLTRSVEERVEETYKACKSFLMIAEMTGVSHVGQLGKPVRYTPVGLLQRYLEHGTFSTDRKKWRALCDGMKIWSAVDEWSVGESKEDTKLWEEFRVAMKAFLLAKGNRDQSLTYEKKTPAERNVVAKTIKKEQMFDRYKELTSNPDWIHYMTVLFPEWMSHTPGGLNYQMDTYLDIQQRAIRWHNVTNRLVEAAQALNVRLDGGPGICFDDTKENGRVVRFSMAAELRKMRNGWKKEMRHADLHYNDEMWRLPDARTGVWDDEWLEFRSTVKKMFEKE